MSNYPKLFCFGSIILKHQVSCRESIESIQSFCPPGFLSFCIINMKPWWYLSEFTGCSVLHSVDAGLHTSPISLKTSFVTYTYTDTHSHTSSIS